MPSSGFAQVDGSAPSATKNMAGRSTLERVRPVRGRTTKIEEPNSALRTDGNFLSEDFCVLDGEHFFVRALMEIPVQGIEGPFGFGCWTTLSRDNFDRYVDQFDEGSPPDQEPWWGWLSNGLADLATEEPVGVLVYPQPDRRRPLLKVAEEDHPLAIAQRDGLSPQKMLDIFTHYGHAPAA